MEFCCRSCSNVYLFSSLVFGLKLISSQKFYLNSESIVYRVRCDFTNERYCLEMNDLFRMYFRFRNCSMVVQLFLNTVFRSLSFVFSVVDFLLVKAIFRFDFVKKWRFQNIYLLLKLLDDCLLNFEYGAWVRSDCLSIADWISRYKTAVNLKEQRN